MNPRNRQSIKYIFVIAFASISLLAVIGATPTSPLPQVSFTITPTSLLTTPTIIATASPVNVQALTPNGPTNQDLLVHFEKVTSFMLTVATLVIGVLGVLGGLGIYLGKSTLSELSDQVDKLKNRISEMEITQEKLNNEITRAEDLSQSLL